MQAITTTLIRQTETKPLRIKASCDRGSRIYTYQHISDSLSGLEDHIHAATTLIREFIAEDLKRYGSDVCNNSWASKFVTGSTSKGMVHVFTEEDESDLDCILRIDPLKVLNEDDDS